MGTASRLAVTLDAEMLSPLPGIASARTSDATLRSKCGTVVAEELGGRYLLRYLLSSQIHYFARGVSNIPPDFLSRPQYLTPSPLAPEETVSWLALPVPDEPREYVLLLDPAKLASLRGPRWVRMGGGIEYIVDSVDPGAIVDVGSAPGTKWPVRVT